MGGGNTEQLAARSEVLRVGLARAAGGISSILNEFSRISFEIDGGVQVDWMMKRVQFFLYELHARVGSSQENLALRLDELNHFFFIDQGFKVDVRENGLKSINDWLLQSVLVNRIGSCEVIATLYAFFAEKIGINIEFVEIKEDTGNIWLLRWKAADGSPRFIDPRRGGRVLECNELLELLHLTSAQQAEMAGLLEPKKMDSLVVGYVGQLKKIMSFEKFGEKLLRLQNLLIAWRPSEMRFLAERAFLYRRMGDSLTALADLKRYFSFQDRDKAPSEVVSLFDELNQSLHPN